MNGRRTVYMPVTKRADASTLAVVGLVKANLAKSETAVPDDVNVAFEFDQTPVVSGAMNNLVKEGALGAVLPGLMVLLFLRSGVSGDTMIGLDGPSAVEPVSEPATLAVGQLCLGAGTVRRRRR